MNKFIEFSKEENILFSSIRDLMYHSHKDDGKNFLCTLNNTIDYVLDIKQDKNINYQIIHIPNSPKWARSLLIKFLIQKISLTTSKENIEHLLSNIVSPIISNNNKEVKDIKDRNSYLRNIKKTFQGKEIPSNTSKTIIITKELDIITTKEDKHPWIKDHFTTNLIDTKKNVVLLNSTTAHDIENQIRTIEKDNIPKVNNIFIFHSKGKAKCTNSYNIDQLNRLNQFGMGIKNCIIFSLSTQKIRLYHTTYNIKHLLASALLNKSINKYNDFNGFITFTNKETDYLFNTQNKQKIELIDCDERQLILSEVEYYLEHFPSNLLSRSILSICLNENLQNQFLETITDKHQYAQEKDFKYYLSLLSHISNNIIIPKINSYIEDSCSVGFIVPYSTPKTILDSFRNIFHRPKRTIKFYSFNDLKKGINTEKIVVLDYKYTNDYYKAYPNSFDLLPINDKQSALIIINRLTHNTYFEWNKYWYDRDINKLLYSTFRKEVLSWNEKKITTPNLQSIEDYLDEYEDESRKYMTEKCRVYYKDLIKPKEMLACEKILYTKNGGYYISELKDISDMQDISCQLLGEIVEQTKILISQKNKENTNTEIIIRNEYKDIITEEEIKSTVELWKILLKKEVEMNGKQETYDKIFEPMSDNERISLDTFSQWYNYNNDLILPRSKKHQKAILKFLNFDKGSIYHRIMISKKINNIRNSRFLNLNIERLLQITLTKTIDDNLFREIYESFSDIISLLDIKCTNDLKTLVDLLEIKLTTINKIEYD